MSSFNKMLGNFSKKDRKRNSMNAVDFNKDDLRDLRNIKVRETDLEVNDNSRPKDLRYSDDSDVKYTKYTASPYYSEHVSDQCSFSDTSNVTDELRYINVENQIKEKKEKYEKENFDKKERYENEIFDKKESLYETRDNFQQLKKKFDTGNGNDVPKIKKQQNSFICGLCDKSSIPGGSQFVILNCSHIFHINCLANIQLELAINCKIIDEDTFFNKVKCPNCEDQLESSEIMMIHNKFHKTTNTFIKDHDEIINKLDLQINKLKDEMKICMEYKQKLEFEQQKSKQIITIINTMPNF